VPLLTIVTGLLLVVCGLVVTTKGFETTNAFHPTAMLPAFFGIAFVLLGALAYYGGNVRKHAMHAAAALSLIGTLGGAFMPIKALIAGTFDPWGYKDIEARRARKASEAAGGTPIV
jgi:uncharacterized protein YqgC (DUF456 family)